MKQLLILLLAVSGKACAQLSLADSVYRTQNKITTKSSLVLSGWGAINLASGLAASAKANCSGHYFHKTNTIFGFINLGLGQLGYWSGRGKKDLKPGAQATFKSQEKLEKLFLFNAGLDVAYISVGAYLLDKAGSQEGTDRDKTKGRGQSILMNGAFLFLFDGILYLLHNKNGNRLDKYLRNVSITALPSGFTLSCHF
jgi:hypothetical protein